MQKNIKAPKNFHIANNKVPGGDYYGSGIKNPTGRLRESPSVPKIKKTIGKPPKSLA